jgi:hypothetical protein
MDYTCQASVRKITVLIGPSIYIDIFWFISWYCFAVDGWKIEMQINKQGEATRKKM